MNGVRQLDSKYFVLCDLIYKKFPEELNHWDNQWLLGVGCGSRN